MGNDVCELWGGTKEWAYLPKPPALPQSPQAALTPRLTLIPSNAELMLSAEPSEAIEVIQLFRKLLLVLCKGTIISFTCTLITFTSICCLDWQFGEEFGRAAGESRWVCWNVGYGKYSFVLWYYERKCLMGICWWLIPFYSMNCHVLTIYNTPSTG